MILSRIFLLSLFFFLKNIINCQSFLPVSYATHQLYSFDKVTPHEIKRNLKNTVGNFIARKLKDIKSKFNSYKNYVHDGDMDNDNNNNGYNSNNNDITKHDYNESLGEEVKSLLQQARNKRKLSKKIKESYERALKNLQKRKNDNSGDYNDNDEKTSKILQHNLEQINYLNKKSNYLENRAEELKKYLKISTNQNYEQVNNCNISKTGKLKFVSSSNELPIKLIGNVQQCFLFEYKNSNQIFCADNSLKSASWINALTEGSLCSNFGIKGVLVNINDINNKLMKMKKIDEDMVTVDIKSEDEGSTHVLVNGKEQKGEGNNNVINLNNIKKKMEEEKRSKKKEEEKEEEKEGRDEVAEDEETEDKLTEVQKEQDDNLINDE
ncbi:PH-like domain-containing protein [Plasmodium brasilianum]|uniref:PH-like domain-containing protein n=1 Tax=Plasmodium brasilianum TaxID=5824 RepID=A0ACB9YCG4_PLABR|nr:PH-like domain-containing protein [Plasmodium brasilianum]